MMKIKISAKERKLFLARVKAGIAFLDVVKPKWVKKIKLSKLTLDGTKTCVLGQSFGDYFDGQFKLGLSDEESAALGFYIDEDNHYSDYDVDKSYDVLNMIWVEELKKLGAK